MLVSAYPSFFCYWPDIVSGLSIGRWSIGSWFRKSFSRSGKISFWSSLRSAKRGGAIAQSWSYLGSKWRLTKVSVQVVSCCGYGIQKIMLHTHSSIPCMSDHWVDPVIYLHGIVVDSSAPSFNRHLRSRVWNPIYALTMICLIYWICHRIVTMNRKLKANIKFESHANHLSFYFIYSQIGAIIVIVLW